MAKRIRICRNYEHISINDKRRNCKHCNKELKSIYAVIQHERCCKSNPTRVVIKPSYGMLGKKGANQFTTGRRKCLSQVTKDKIKLALKNREKPRKTYYSKISQDLFWNIYGQLSAEQQKHAKFAELNREKFIKIGEKFTSVDFVYKNICIEFYGDLWHANPAKYKENDKPSPIKELSHLTAKEIWNRDAERNRILEERGYSVYIVWEIDYIKNKQKIIQNMLEVCNSIVL